MAMMLMIGIVSSDIYLPSMPYMKNYFGVSYSYIQHTLLYYLIVLSIMQLISGPLSDHLGKKRFLLLGGLIYFIASIGCIFCTSIWMLYISRILQAVGACAILIVGRKIISDNHNSKDAANIYSIVLPIVSLSPAIAPVIGGFIQTYLGWQANFGFLAIFSLILIPLALYYIKKIEVVNNANSKRIKIMHGYFTLLKSKLFLIFVALVSIAYFMWFSYLSDSASIYHEFGLNAKQIGFCYISQSFAAIIGTRLGAQLLKTISSHKLFLIATINGFISALIIFTMGHASVTYFLIGITLMAFTTGIMITFGISFAMSSAVKTCRAASGTASGLVGCLQIAGGALGTLITSFFSPTTSSLGLLLIVSTLISITMVIFQGWAD